MPGLKEIRTRIASIKTTRQVTSAMKMVSAAKLKKAQDAIIHFRPYAGKLREILFHLAGSSDCDIQSPYCQQRAENKILLVVISSNRGLCGGFNLNIARTTSSLIKELFADQYNKGDLEILSIGKQGDRQLHSLGIKVGSSFHEIWDKFTYDEIDRIASGILDSFIDGRFDKVILIYNEFINAAIQNPVIADFLPIQVPTGEVQQSPELVIYEPSKSQIINELIPRMLKTEFHKAMLDSHAAEHGARMTAMHLATDNATELIGDLTLQYNKARQSAITKEILEITGGAEALRS